MLTQGKLYDQLISLQGTQSLRLNMKEDDTKSFIIQKDVNGELKADAQFITEEDMAANRYKVTIQQDTFIDSQYQVLLED